MTMSEWTGASRPARIPLEGRYVRLEPLDLSRHGDDLFQSAGQPGADRRFRYLFDLPPDDRVDFEAWLQKAAASPDPLFFAVIDRATGRAEGRQTLMRIDATHGVIEVGNILWGPAIARTRVATEALYLFARHVFEDLGYRRFEWKCDALNLPSRRSADRFGFTPEGIFRQHMVVKGRNRDTAWFSIVDGEWPRLKRAYDRWLQPDNFDGTGAQMTKLSVGGPAATGGGHAP